MRFQILFNWLSNIQYPDNLLILKYLNQCGLKNVGYCVQTWMFWLRLNMNILRSKSKVIMHPYTVIVCIWLVSNCNLIFVTVFVPHHRIKTKVQNYLLCWTSINDWWEWASSTRGLFVFFLQIQLCIRLDAVSYRCNKVRIMASPAVRSVNKFRDTQNCIQDEPQYAICVVFTARLYHTARWECWAWPLIMVAPHEN